MKKDEPRGPSLFSLAESGSGLFDSGRRRLHALRLAIASQPLHHAAMRAERIQRALALVRGADLAIDIEDVLPGFAMDRARLDLGEIGAQGGKRGNRGDQLTG